MAPDASAAPKGTARRDMLLALQDKAQAKWDKVRTHSALTRKPMSTAASPALARSPELHAIACAADPVLLLTRGRSRPSKLMLRMMASGTRANSSSPFLILT